MSLLVFIPSFIIWLVMSDFEFGKYDSLDEAIEKGIPYDVNSIIHIQEAHGTTAVMFAAKPDEEGFPHADFEGLGAVFFEGSDEEGWEKVGGNSWTHSENNMFTFYNESFLKEHESVFVVFGKITNPDILTIETKAKKDTSFDEAEIINKNGQRYYFQVGRESIVRGLSRSGDVIYEQGG